MVVLDANILIYAYTPGSPHHARAAAWLEGLLGGGEIVGLPWPSIWAFLRVVTNPQLRPAVRPEVAFEAVKAWLEQPVVELIGPGARHFELLERAMVDGQATGKMASDAVLAAIAMEHGAVLASTDRDFARFPGLRWVNPLES